MEMVQLRRHRRHSQAPSGAHDRLGAGAVRRAARRGAAALPGIRPRRARKPEHPRERRRAEPVGDGEVHRAAARTGAGAGEDKRDPETAEIPWSAVVEGALYRGCGEGAAEQKDHGRGPAARVQSNGSGRAGRHALLDDQPDYAKVKIQDLTPIIVKGENSRNKPLYQGYQGDRKSVV